MQDRVWEPDRGHGGLGHGLKLQKGQDQRSEPHGSASSRPG